MPKTTYSRAALEKSMSKKSAQDFLLAQASAKANDKSFTGRVIRIFTREGDKKVMQQVIIAQS